MFNFKTVPYKKQDGTMTNVILVTGDKVDSTYEYKEQMKNFGAKWINSMKTWGWWGSLDSNKMRKIIEGMVKPAIEFLLSKEKSPSDDPNRSLETILDELLSALGNNESVTEDEAKGNVFMTREEIKNKIQEFKENLVNCVNGDEFKRLIAPIINARKAQGYKYSFHNTILIWVQDPEARLVKSRGKWKKYYNRDVVPNAPAIGMYVPVGGEKEFKENEQRKQAKEKWLSDRGFKSEKELTIGEKEILNAYLNQIGGMVSFKFAFCFYDQRYTKPIPGKEDLLGDTDTSKIPWYNNNGNETEAVKEKIYALLKVVSNSGVNVSKQKNLSGALGVSKGGSIDVLEDAKMNSNFLMTLSHEFAHELLHQTYLRDSNNGKEWGQFYAGREQGRGFIEQQAELTAWIVCKFYGYDIQEAINYAALWGMDAKNAVHAFDSVAKVSDFIINKINEIIKQERGVTMAESKQRVIKEANFSGLDVAKMVGAEKLYLQGLDEFKAEEEAEMRMTESFNRLKNKMDEIFKRNVQDVID